MNSELQTPARWSKLGSRLEARTQIFDLRQARFRHPVRKTEKEFVVVDAPKWVNVIALTPEGGLVLVRQFRFGINEFSLETPGGIVEPEEAVVAAGERELREETGYAGSGAHLLGVTDPNPAFQNNRCYFVLVPEAQQVSPPSWDPDEEIEIVVKPVAEALCLAREGGITHSLVLNALFLLEPVWRARSAG